MNVKIAYMALYLQNSIIQTKTNYLLSCYLFYFFLTMSAFIVCSGSLMLEAILNQCSLHGVVLLQWY